MLRMISDVADAVATLIIGLFVLAVMSAFVGFGIIFVIGETLEHFSL